MDNHPLDRLFRDKLSERDFAFDPKGWEEVESLLPSKKKRRGGFIWWAGLALLIGLGAIGLFYSNIETNDLDNASEVASPIHQIENTEDVPKQESAIDEKIPINTKENLSSSPNVSDASNEPVTNQSAEVAQEVQSFTAHPQTSSVSTEPEPSSTTTENNSLSNSSGPASLQKITNEEPAEDSRVNESVTFDNRETLDDLAFIPGLDLALLDSKHRGISNLDQAEFPFRVHTSLLAVDLDNRMPLPDSSQQWARLKAYYQIPLGRHWGVMTGAGVSYSWGNELVLGKSQEEKVDFGSTVTEHQLVAENLLSFNLPIQIYRSSGRTQASFGVDLEYTALAWGALESKKTESLLFITSNPNPGLVSYARDEGLVSLQDVQRLSAYLTVDYRYRLTTRFDIGLGARFLMNAPDYILAENQYYLPSRSSIGLHAGIRYHIKFNRNGY